jgi:hypothetical protein
MSQAVAVDVAVDIPSLIRRYQLPEHYYPSHLRHPNQPFSSPSSVSSWSSASPPTSPPTSSSVSSFDQECDVNESSGAISVDGEVDTLIDIIEQQQQQQQPIIVVVEKRQALYPSCMSVCVCASAPPLSDDDIEHENSHNQQQRQIQQQQQQKEEVCVCVICYETFEQTFEQLIRGRNYSMEELEEIEGKQKITDFCQTCKYNVHHKCIDEYRLSKMTDMIRSGYQRGRIQSPNIAGTFGMKCLMCAKEVEKIHISSDGDINIVKTQTADASEQNRGQQQQQQQQHQIEEVMQNRIEEVMHNRMQRRVRRRHRLEFCRKKLCSICIMFLVTILLLVFIFRVI